MKDKEFKKQLKRMNSRIPYLASQVFALRNKSYNGFGFHYALEKRLGKIIRWINDSKFIYHPKSRDKFINRMILEIDYRALATDIVLARQSLSKNYSKTCKNCKWWGVDYEGICDFEKRLGATRFELEADSDDDQGLTCSLHTGPDFGCVHFKK